MEANKTVREIIKEVRASMEEKNYAKVTIKSFHPYCYYNPNRHRSGTAQTVRMAQRKNIMIFNFYGCDVESYK